MFIHSKDITFWNLNFVGKYNLRGIRMGIGHIREINSLTPSSSLDNDCSQSHAVQVQWWAADCQRKRPSLGAHSACQLSIGDVWTTGECTTSAFHGVQQGTILEGLGSRNILWVGINTDEIFGIMVCVMWSHQVPMILLGPSIWAVIPCGHHQHWATWLDVTDSARGIVVMETSLKRVSIVLINSVLNTVHDCSHVLVSIFVLVIFWIVRKAKVVDLTTSVARSFSTRYTW